MDSGILRDLRALRGEVEFLAEFSDFDMAQDSREPRKLSGARSYQKQVNSSRQVRQG
jgi:hypothetical protein